MDTSIARQLVELNRRFYQEFAGEFAESRTRLHDGIERCLKARQWSQAGSVLDVGCGDARVGRALRDRGFAGCYLGVDVASALLQVNDRADLELRAADITQEGWSADLDEFEQIYCFSVLHHIPTAALRQRLMLDLAQALTPGGSATLSVWRFRHVPRLRKKVVAWSRLELRDDQVDAGDFLLDWQRGGAGLRYVHHFEPDEVEDLCRTAGLDVVNTFESDAGMGAYVEVQKPR